MSQRVSERRRSLFDLMPALLQRVDHEFDEQPTVNSRAMQRSHVVVESTEVRVNAR
jgi:hypothetical protein